MSLTKSENFVKYSLFVFNFLFVVSELNFSQHSQEGMDFCFKPQFQRAKNPFYSVQILIDKIVRPNE